MSSAVRNSLISVGTSDKNFNSSGLFMQRYQKGKHADLKRRSIGVFSVGCTTNSDAVDNGLHIKTSESAKIMEHRRRS